ncbi:MAG: PD40 domain-containing protein, partial [Myxococcales bacterium]|nr:PD40 domain-containing protein [Myxococcales bacterium]
RPLGPASRGSKALAARSGRKPIVVAGAFATLVAFAVGGFWLSRGREAPPSPSEAPSASDEAVTPAPFVLRASGHRRVTYDAGCEEFPSFFPDGKRIVFDVTSGHRSHLFVADVDSGEARQLTTSPGWDFAARVSPDGKQIVFLRADDERMGAYAVDADGSAPPRFLIAGGIRPSFTADGKHVWGGQPMKPTRVDAATGAVLEEALLPGNRQAWNVLGLANGDLAISMPPFMEGNKGGVSIGSATPDGRVFRDLLVDSVEEVLALAPDGAHLISARYGPNAAELLAIPIAGGPTLRLGDAAIAPGKGVAFSADGKRVVWSTCRSYANVVPASDSAAAPSPAWEDLDAARLPDGKLAVISARDGSLKPWILDPSGKLPPRALAAGADVSDLAASPDGKSVIVTTPAGLMVLSTEQEPSRMLTKEVGDSEPSFSRDGKQVLFTRRARGTNEIHRISIDGGDATRTHAIGSQACALDDGADFVFIEEREGKQQPMVWRAARASAEPLAATLPPARYGRPDVSPDGKLIALPHRGTEVLLLNRASGRLERTITMSGDQLDRPIFLSDGSLYVNRIRWLGDVWVADLGP